MPVEFESRSGDEPWSNDRQVILFQVVRELLVNVGKHSQASQAKVILSQEEQSLKIQVNDDGVGFDATKIYDARGRERRFRLFQHARAPELSRRQSGGQVQARPGLADRADGAAGSPAAGREEGEGMNVKIIIADDHKIMRDGLRNMLEKESGMEVIAEAKNGREAVRLAEQLRPDILIMDITMDDLNGMDATRAIVAKELGSRVIALSMHADKRFVAGMFEAGAMGYLLKECAYDELLQAIRQVLGGRTYLCSMISGVVIRDYIQRMRKSEPSLLSPREKEILQLMAEGSTTKRIADQLKVSVKTVETHRQHVMEKLNIFSIAELTKYAIKEGITSLDT